jgi:hypothetical protein
VDRKRVELPRNHVKVIATRGYQSSPFEAEVEAKLLSPPELQASLPDHWKQRQQCVAIGSKRLFTSQQEMFQILQLLQITGVQLAIAGMTCLTIYSLRIFTSSFLTFLESSPIVAF